MKNVRTILFGFMIGLVISVRPQGPTFEWVANLGESNVDAAESIVVDSMGNVYTMGQFSGVVDFDPGLGTFNLVSTGTADIFVQKLNARGDLIWAKNIGGSTVEQAEGLTTDIHGNIHSSKFRRM